MQESQGSIHVAADIAHAGGGVLFGVMVWVMFWVKVRNMVMA